MGDDEPIELISGDFRFYGYTYDERCVFCKVDRTEFKSTPMVKTIIDKLSLEMLQLKRNSGLLQKSEKKNLLIDYEFDGSAIYVDVFITNNPVKELVLK